MKTYKVVTNFFYKNNSFKIVLDDEDWYLAVNAKHLDENGRTTKQLTGYELCASETLAECIDHIKFRIDLAELTAQGINSLVAMKMLHDNISREEAEKDEELLNIIKKLEKLSK